MRATYSPRVFAGKTRRPRPGLMMFCGLASLACGSTKTKATRSPHTRSYQRAIVLAPAITDLVLAIGGANQLVARTDFDRDSRTATLPSVGATTDPNLEAILRARPDLVITWEDGSEQRQLARIGRLGVLTVPMRTSRLDDLRDNLSQLGVLFDRRKAAESLWKQIDDSLRAIAGAATPRQRPRVFFIAWQRPLVTAGHGSFIDTLIWIAGGANVFGDQHAPWPTVALEAAVARDPDVILLSRSTVQSRRDLQAAPFRAFRAVRLNRVVEIDSDLLDRPGPRIADAARALQRALAR